MAYRPNYMMAPHPAGIASSEIPAGMCQAYDINIGHLFQECLAPEPQPQTH